MNHPESKLSLFEESDPSEHVAPEEDFISEVEPVEDAVQIAAIPAIALR